jgi:hypothetical protein
MVLMFELCLLYLDYIIDILDLLFHVQALSIEDARISAPTAHFSAAQQLGQYGLLNM